MTTQLIDFIKSGIMAFTMLSFGIYQGAALIALIAALSRLAYTADQPTFRLFGRFFIMSLSLTMLVVHIGLLEKWDNNLVVIVSGVSAFLCREVLEVLISSKDTIVSKILERLK